MFPMLIFFAEVYYKNRVKYIIEFPNWLVKTTDMYTVQLHPALSSRPQNISSSYFGQLLFNFRIVLES